MALYIKLPAVVDTPQPTIFIAAKKHAGSAVGTSGIDDPYFALRIPKSHQIFAEDAQAYRRPIAQGQFLGEQHGVPKTAK
jgi:hypothetical protein